MSLSTVDINYKRKIK